MKVCVRARALPDFEALESYALRRAEFQLSRYGSELRTVMVRVTDENGPRGGIDKRCQVTVTSRRLGAVFVQEMDADARAAISLSIERASRAVARMVERAHERRVAPKQRWHLQPLTDEGS